MVGLELLWIKITDCDYYKEFIIHMGLTNQKWGYDQDMINNECWASIKSSGLIQI